VVMKKCIIFLCLCFLLGNARGVWGVDDPFDAGQSRMSASEVLLSAGITALMHPDEVKSMLDTTKDKEKKKDQIDSKVDDAIKKAWEEK
jgi:hypothetical protein